MWKTRKLLPVVFSSLALISSGALAADSVKPKAKDQPATSSSSTGPSRPDTVQEQEDEKKATQSKEKMKKKPGYQDEAPSPRASHTGLVIN